MPSFLNLFVPYSILFGKRLEFTNLWPDRQGKTAKKWKFTLSVLGCHIATCYNPCQQPPSRVFGVGSQGPTCELLRSPCTQTWKTRRVQRTRANPLLSRLRRTIRLAPTGPEQRSLEESESKCHVAAWECKHRPIELLACGTPTQCNCAKGVKSSGAYKNINNQFEQTY